jgi:hypothetical protein
MNNAGNWTMKKRTTWQLEPHRLHGHPGRRAHHVDHLNAFLPRHHDRTRIAQNVQIPPQKPAPRRLI